MERRLFTITNERGLLWTGEVFSKESHQPADTTYMKTGFSLDAGGGNNALHQPAVA